MGICKRGSSMTNQSIDTPVKSAAEDVHLPIVSSSTGAAVTAVIRSR